jgi:hypothetical protein
MILVEHGFVDYTLETRAFLKIYDVPDVKQLIRGVELCLVIPLEEVPLLERVPLVGVISDEVQEILECRVGLTLIIGLHKVYDPQVLPIVEATDVRLIQDGLDDWDTLWHYGENYRLIVFDPLREASEVHDWASVQDLGVSHKPELY